jgi:hypothetical protein
VKFEIEKMQSVEVTHLLAEMGVRYWEDGVVNGEPDDEDNPQIPLRSGGVWRLRIDLATGKIDDWPDGVTASVHYKVCDDGFYSLLDQDGRVVAEKSDYVPAMLCPAGRGWGYYVIMDIGADGVICDWNPDLSFFSDTD